MAKKLSKMQRLILVCVMFSVSANSLASIGPMSRLPSAASEVLRDPSPRLGKDLTRGMHDQGWVTRTFKVKSSSPLVPSIIKDYVYQYKM